MDKKNYFSFDKINTLASAFEYIDFGKIIISHIGIKKPTCLLFVKVKFIACKTIYFFSLIVKKTGSPRILIGFIIFYLILKLLDQNFIGVECQKLSRMNGCMLF